MFKEFIKVNSCLVCAKYIDLKFTHSELIPEFCLTVTSSPRLKALTLSNITPIREVVKGLKKIYKQKKEFFQEIKELDISSNTFEGDIDTLKDFLKLFPKVKTLNISGCGLAEDIVEIIGDINKGLKVIKMSLNGITADICNGLKFLFPRKLQQLELDGNWLGMKGVYNLRWWFIETGARLKVLNLSNNKIFRDEHNAEYLASLLSHVPNLEELNLGVNSMEDEDLAILTKPISDMQSLTRLTMNTGLLKKNAAQYIISILTALKNLVMLNLMSNILEDEGCGKIFEHLKDNNSLKCLDLSSNRTKGECIEKLLEYAENFYNGRELMIKLMGSISLPAKKKELITKLKAIRSTKPHFALDVKLKPNSNPKIIKPY